jgi:tetratricopeptide (TPR) repeat protein
MAAMGAREIFVMANLGQALDLAVEQHQAGNLRQAEQLYRQVLAVDPLQMDALHLLGVVAHQTGHNEQAIEYIDRAIAVDPRRAPFHNNLGAAYQALGRLEDAVTCYQRALQVNPGYAEAHNNLGLARVAQGKREEAVACYQRALQLRPNYAEAHVNLGIVLREQGRLPEAVASLRHGLRFRPREAKAHNNLGVTLMEQGQPDEAIASYQEAVRLDPNYAEALNNLAGALQACGRLQEAAANLQQLVRLRPESVETYKNLGMILRKLRRYEDASACYDQALRLKPDSAEVHNNLGILLWEQARYKEALTCHQEALRLRPDYGSAHNNLGINLLELGQPEAAVISLREAVRLNPNFAEARNNLGNALRALGLLEEAVASFEEALRLRPEYPEAHNNRALVPWVQGQFAEATAGFQQAIHLKPDYAEAHKNLAMTWLLEGNFEQGWPEYEWRWQCKEFSPPNFPQPLWDGSDLTGRTILLHAEQGLGDTLQFIRYAPLVKQRGGTVIFACPEMLVPLVSRCAGVDQLVVHTGVPFDVHAPLLSLPRLFQTTSATAPADIPYIHADVSRVEYWAQELRGIEDFKIGICWQGSRGHQADRQRSISLSQFAPLARLEGVRLISLQKGPGAEQVAALAEDWPITDFGGRLDEVGGAFMDTAALMQSLDLVITCDTAVAHLAGALGVPTWVALAFVPDWRWLLEREDSPWYPSMRLFRQKRPGDWQEVFARIATAVAQRLSAGSRRAPIRVPISAGELLDKISILEIKETLMTDPAKLRNVRTELTALRAVSAQALAPCESLPALTAELRAVNQTLWQVEDDIRLCEKAGDFGPRFIELARSVYRHNDHRAALKRQINELLGSEIREEKAYA